MILQGCYKRQGDSVFLDMLIIFPGAFDLVVGVAHVPNLVNTNDTHNELVLGT